MCKRCTYRDFFSRRQHRRIQPHKTQKHHHAHQHCKHSAKKDHTPNSKWSQPTTTTTTAADSSISKAPDLNGKMILPINIAAAGLKGHKVAAVYAILDSN